jgi:hypothetical protein
MGGYVVKLPVINLPVEAEHAQVRPVCGVIGDEELEIIGHLVVTRLAENLEADDNNIRLNTSQRDGRLKPAKGTAVASNAALGAAALDASRLNESNTTVVPPPQKAGKSASIKLPSCEWF